MYRALTYYAMQKHYLQEGEFFKNLLIADLNKIEIGFDAQDIPCSTARTWRAKSAR